MGNIVIANMQATLTLDNKDFEEKAARAQATLEQLEARSKNLAGEARSLVGVDMADGGVERRQRRQLERAQENREEVDVVTRTSNAAVAAAVVEEGTLRRRREAFQAYARTLSEWYTLLGSQADALIQKNARLIPDAVPTTLGTATLPAPAVPPSLVEMGGGWTGGAPAPVRPHVAPTSTFPFATPPAQAAPVLSTRPVLPLGAPAPPPVPPPVPPVFAVPHVQPVSPANLPREIDRLRAQAEAYRLVAFPPAAPTPVAAPRTSFGMTAAEITPIARAALEQQVGKPADPFVFADNLRQGINAELDQRGQAPVGPARIRAASPLGAALIAQAMNRQDPEAYQVSPQAQQVLQEAAARQEAQRQATPAVAPPVARPPVAAPQPPARPSVRLPAPVLRAVQEIRAALAANPYLVGELGVERIIEAGTEQELRELHEKHTPPAVTPAHTPAGPAPAAPASLTTDPDIIKQAQLMAGVTAPKRIERLAAAAGLAPVPVPASPVRPPTVPPPPARVPRTLITWEQEQRIQIPDDIRNLPLAEASTRMAELYPGWRRDYTKEEMAGLPPAKPPAPAPGSAAPRTLITWEQEQRIQMPAEIRNLPLAEASVRMAELYPGWRRDYTKEEMAGLPPAKPPALPGLPGQPAAPPTAPATPVPAAPPTPSPYEGPSDEEQAQLDRKVEAQRAQQLAVWSAQAKRPVDPGSVLGQAQRAYKEEQARTGSKTAMIPLPGGEGKSFQSTGIASLDDMIVAAVAARTPGQSVREAMESVDPNAAQAAPDGGDDPDERVDPADPRRGPRRGSRGSREALSYQRYLAFNTPVGGAVQGFLGQLSPALTQLSPAFVSGGLAVAAFGLVLGQAAKHGLELEKSLFQLTSTMKANVEGFTGDTKFLEAQNEAMRALGFTNAQTGSSFAELVTWTQNSGEALKLQGLAADFARAKGIELNTASLVFTQILQGNTGGLRQYGINVSEGATSLEAFRKIQAAVNGEAERFAKTGAGDAAKLNAEWENALDTAGEALMPTIQALTRDLIALMPVVTSLLVGVGDVVSAVATPLANIFGPMGDGADATTLKVRELLKAQQESRAEAEKAAASKPQELFLPGSAGASSVMQGFAWGMLGGVSDEEKQREAARREFLKQWKPPAGLSMGPDAEFDKFWEQAKGQVAIATTTAYNRAQYGGGGVGGGGPTAMGVQGPDFEGNSGPAISAIRAISDEMDLTRTAVQGVQEAYTSFTLFTVDYDAIRGKVDEFARAVKYLQNIFSDIARDEDLNAYRKTTTYLQAAQAAAGVVSTSAQAFTAIFDTQALMPTAEEQRAFGNRIVQMLTFFKPVADQMMPEAGGASLPIEKLNAFSKAASSMMQMAQESAKALDAVQDLRPPNTAAMKRFVDLSRDALKMLDGMLSDLYSGGTGISPPPGGQSAAATPGGASLGISGAVADQAAKLMAYAGSTASVFEQFRTLRLPSTDTLRQFAARSKVLTTEFAALAAESMGEERKGGIMGAIEAAIQSVFPPERSADPRLQRAGRWAEDAAKLNAYAASAASVFENMRGLRLPTADAIRSLAKQSVTLVNTLVDFVPQDAEFGKPPDIKDEAEWAGYGTTLVGLVGAAAGVYENMRRLRIPSPDQIAEISERAVGMVKGLATLVPKGADGKPPDIQGEAEWAGFGSTMIGMVGAAAGVYENMRRLRIPSPDQIAQISQRAVDMVVGLSGMVPKGADGHPPDIKDEAEWAGFGSTMIGMVGNVVSVYENMRRLRMPSPDQIAEISRRAVDMVVGLSGMVPKGAGGAPPDLFDEAEWAGFGTSLIGMVSSAVGLYENMRRLRIPSEDRVREVVKQATALPGIIAASAGSGDALYEAGRWAEDAAKLVSLASGTADLLKGLRRFREPSEDDVSDFITGMRNITAKLLSIGGQGASDSMVNAVLDWTDAVGPLVAIAASTADLLQSLRRYRDPSEEAVSDFVSMTDRVADMLLGISAGGITERASMAAEDWALAVGPIVEVARSSAELLASLRTYRQPTMDHINDFLLSTEYVAEGFAQMSARWSLDIAEHAGDIAEQQGKIFTTMQSAEGVFSGLHTLGKVPLVQIEGFFDNMDQAVGIFNSRAAAWNAEMDKSVLVVSDDIEAQMGAMSSGADFFLKLGKLKPDYSNAIRGFFSQLKLATQEFAKAVPDWKAQMNDDTKDVADAVTQQGNALSAALAPLLQIENATDIGPEQIKLAFMNARKALTYFSDLRNAPELQGDGAGGLLLFSSQIAEIFGAMQTTIDAVTALNEPSGELNTQMFGTIMNDFFLEAVPRYGQQWHITMGEMSADAAAFAQTTGAAIGSIPMHSLVGTTRSYSVAGTEGAGGENVNVRGATAGGSLNTGPVYYNCVFLDGVQVGQDPNMDAFIAKWTRAEDIRQGGVPVGAVAAGKR